MLPRHLIENIMLHYASVCGENKVPHLTRVCKEWRLFLVKLMIKWHRYLYALSYQCNTNEEYSWRSELIPQILAQPFNLDFLVTLLVHGDPDKHALVWSQEQYPFRSKSATAEALLRYPHTTNYLLFSKLEISTVVHCVCSRLDLLWYLYQNGVRIDLGLQGVLKKHISLPLLQFLIRVEKSPAPEILIDESRHIQTKIHYSTLMFEESNDIHERGAYEEMIEKFFG